MCLHVHVCVHVCMCMCVCMCYAGIYRHMLVPMYSWDARVGRSALSVIVGFTPLYQGSLLPLELGWRPASL